MAFPISKILLPVDFSGYSETAYRIALQIALRTNAEITLLHVLQPPYNFASEINEMSEELEKQAHSRLKILKSSKEGKAEDVQVDKAVASGMPAATILSYCEKIGADLIVMGSKGKGGVEKAIFGSVSENVMLNSPLPVLVLPDIEEPSDLKKILFATDYRSGDPENLDKTIDLARLFDAGIDVVHVAKEADIQTEIKLRGFKDLFLESSSYPNLQFKTTVHKNLHEGISAYIADNSSSLLVLNRYKTSVLKSLFGINHTKKIGSYARLPMLVLPAE